MHSGAGRTRLSCGQGIAGQPINRHNRESRLFGKRTASGSGCSLRLVNVTMTTAIRLSAGQTLGGRAFNEPRRLQAVLSTGDGVSALRLMGAQRNWFGRVAFPGAELAWLGIPEGIYCANGDRKLLRRRLRALARIGSALVPRAACRSRRSIRCPTGTSQKGCFCWLAHGGSARIDLHRVWVAGGLGRRGRPAVPGGRVAPASASRPSRPRSHDHQQTAWHRCLPAYLAWADATKASHYPLEPRP